MSGAPHSRGVEYPADQAEVEDKAKQAKKE
jgi:hypothetical protein